MKAIDTLIEEHNLILRGLELMTTAAEKIIRDQHPPREFFEMATQFTLNFTNKYHHYKEEIVMFGLLAQKHEGKLDDELERLRNQHKVLHDLMREITDLLDSYAKNIETEVAKLHRNLCTYIDTLRHHVTAENRIFYPLVVDTLTADEMKFLEEEFDKVAAKEEEDPLKVYGLVVDKMEQLV